VTPQAIRTQRSLCQLVVLYARGGDLHGFAATVHTDTHQTTLDDPRLPLMAGGWSRRAIDLGGTLVVLAVPNDPDSLLADEEVLEANRRDDYMPYWASLWPAASEMAGALQHARWPAGTRVLEVGCGLGLVGIAGLMQGWEVTLSDYEPQALRAAAVNAEANGFPHARTAVLDWRRPPAEEYSVILACDVLYEPRNHTPILNLLDTMLAADGCAWIGEPGRTPASQFHHAATDAGYDVTVRNAAGQRQSFPARGQFQILELRRTKHRDE
jgi:predicted nicotinamide N-methyase